MRIPKTLLVITLCLFALSHFVAYAQKRLGLYATTSYRSDNPSEENFLRFLELYDNMTYKWYRGDAKGQIGRYEYSGKYLVLHGASPSEAVVVGSYSSGSLTFRWGGATDAKVMVMCITGSKNWPPTGVDCK